MAPFLVQFAADYRVRVCEQLHYRILQWASLKVVVTKIIARERFGSMQENALDRTAQYGIESVTFN